MYAKYLSIYIVWSDGQWPKIKISTNYIFLLAFHNRQLVKNNVILMTFYHWSFERKMFLCFESCKQIKTSETRGWVKEQIPQRNHRRGCHYSPCWYAGKLNTPKMLHRPHVAPHQPRRGPLRMRWRPSSAPRSTSVCLLLFPENSKISYFRCLH